MSRLRLFLLERDERTVLRHLGRAGAMQLTRTAAGPDTAPLPPRDHHLLLARLEQLSSRLDRLRVALGLPKTEAPLPAVKMPLEQTDTTLEPFEKQSAELLHRRQQWQQRLAETDAIDRQISDYREFDLPLDQPDDSSFLHFITGSLPAKQFVNLQLAGNVAVLPLAEHNGRQILIAVTTHQNRNALDQTLQQAGFQLEILPAATGTTTARLAESNRQATEKATAELAAANAQLRSVAENFAPVAAQIELAIGTERRLLEAEQNFPHTENAVLVTGWMPSADAPRVENDIREMTRGRCVFEITPAEKLNGEEVPVLLREPRLLRPFALLVTAYGLPKYREVEPTLFVAISYLLMFGMMFGDVGHGFIFALVGTILLLTNRSVSVRDAGLLFLFAGSSSMFFGALYGSCFGLEAFKKCALWHDPLAGDPMNLMFIAIAVGIVLISLGLVLNIVNRLRHGDFIGALLDKFGVTGAVFYWLALAMVAKSATLRAHGIFTPALWLLAMLALAWLLKEPVKIWRHRRVGRAVEADFSTVALESCVNVFEGFLSYFANTISFVRLAAYAMSHAALLLAAFMIANDVKHFAIGGSFLAVVVIILGNLVALVLEGIIASVQALRLEYYEFFGKFFAGGGQPFQPFRLPTNTADQVPI